MSSVKNDKIEKYVNEICTLVKNKRVHNSIKEEITNHIEELTHDYMDVGISEEEAVEKAIAQMGSAQVVGRDLNKIHKAAPDYLLIGMTGIFILIGLLILNFIQKNNMISNNYIDMISNMTIYGLGGIVISIIILRIDYRTIKKYSKLIYIASIILLTLSIFVSNTVMGQMGWIRVGNITFNAFTIAPFLLIIALAGMFEQWNWSSLKSIIKGTILVILPCVFFILGRSLVNMIIYVVAALTIMFVSGVRLKHIIVYTGALISGLALYLIAEPYRRIRFTMFLNPEQDMNGSGFIYNQLATLRKSAGLFGNGQSFNYDMLPEAHTDFIFTFLIYCFGWAAGIILIALILAFLARIFYVGTTIKDSYGKLLVNGFCALFLMQFIISLGVNLNLMPAVAASMPFISYGGSSLVINILSVSIISNVFKWRNTPFKASC